MNITTALLLLRPGAEWSVPNGTTNATDITWHEDTTPVTQVELDAKLAEPAPKPLQPTALQKLEAVGLTVEDLRQLLEVTP
jgi:hypothetical protein